MKKLHISIILAAITTLLMVASCSTVPDNPQVRVANALAERVIGRQSSKFIFKISDADTCDFFTLCSKGNKIEITGNNSNSMAVGLNYYLKYLCNIDFGWFKEDKFVLPKRLPKVPAPITIKARVNKRFFLNYCTFGYTMPWWKWEDWEHFIDWMALNGVNLPLAITGQESIWYLIWRELGLNDEEIRSYFTGPAHLPWHRMQNIDRWFGPLPQSWLDGQLELQKKITERERELGMKPVLPAFSGHVPAELARIFPDAPLTKLEAWSGFSDEYACTFLDPMSDLFVEIQKRFVEKEKEIYGTDHIYGIDIFNELMPPSWEPEYLGRVSRQVYESLVAADPDATWLQMGWLFYNERKYWTNDRVEAYLTSFPTERQIILDYYCERQEVWQRTESFFGVPFIWCYLGNFGGNTFLAGDFRAIDERIENTFINGGDNFEGIGATLEGLDCNPYVYEYVLEKAWDTERVKDLSTYIEALSDRRVGKVDSSGRKAWNILIDSVYVQRTTPGQTPLISERPSLGRTKTYYGNPKDDYDNKTLARALEALLGAEGVNSAYSFDLTNLTRQVLSNYFGELKGEYEVAYYERDRDAMKRISSEMLEVADDIDRMLNTQSYFLVGKWIADARGWGNTPAEADYYESNARNLITTWSDADMLLNDYAARTIAGLTGSLYKLRWKVFFDAVEEALEEGEEFDDAHYKVYSDSVTTIEKEWWYNRPGEFSATPVGDSKGVASELFTKYKERLLAN